MTSDTVNQKKNRPPHADTTNSRRMTEEEMFAKGFNGHLLRRILTFALKYRKSLLVALGATLLFTVAEISLPLIVGTVIDTSLASGSFNRTALFIGVGLFLGFVFMRFMSSYVQERIVSNVGELIIIDLRRAMFSHLQRVAFSFMDKTEVGRLMSRLQGDTAALAEFIETSVASVRDFIILFAIIGILLYLDWRLGLLSMAVMPVLFIIRLIWLPRARRAFIHARITSSRVSGALAENINGVRIVEGMNRQEVNYNLFEETANSNLRSQLNASRLSQVMIPTVDILTGLALASVIIMGGWLVVTGDITPGKMVSFFLYVQRFFDPIRTLTLQYNIFQRAMASGERIFEVLDIPLQIKDSPNAKSPAKINGSIEFRNVTFGYEPDIPVLRNISFRINPGETVALVGPTGSGKTSTTALIHRFYEICSGEILIGGHNIQDLTQESLSNHIAMVLQEPFLFSGTVLENIQYSSKNTTRKDVIEAAKAVGAHGFIMNLSDGYDTTLDQRGGNLSVGQRQLLSFARAIITDTEILVLDEATANIDSYTEMLIQQALTRLLKGRTGIVIAHRLATIRDADRIIVLQNGSLIDTGTHHELMKHRGLYARLYSMNYASFDDIPDELIQEASRETAGSAT